jgi:UDP-N-acetylmuramate--alanine ligase
MDSEFGKVVHIIGIGGIGVSGLARFLRANGHTVSGSDDHETPIMPILRKEGIKVADGPYRATSLPANAETVVANAAIAPENPELQEAVRRGIPVLRYAEALARFFAAHRLVAVSGTHGKSTTTGLIGWGLEKLGADPSVLVGAQVPPWRGNIRLGASDLAVIEADEFSKSFFAYRPFLTVVTNVDFDHVETYGGLGDVLAAFIRFVEQTRSDGIVVIPAGEHYTEALARAAGERKVITYGSADADITRARTQLKLRMPGAHNVRNGLAAVAALAGLGFDPDKAARALHTFPGLWRRFERIGALKGAPVYSDYGHHPAELAAVIAAAREVFPKRRLVVAFQPHQAERLKVFLVEFARELSKADVVYLTEVYHRAGREEPGANASSADLGDALRDIGANLKALVPLAELPQALARDAAPHDVFLCIGAGDIDETMRTFLKKTA